MPTPENINPSSQITIANAARGAISSLWFATTIKSYQSVQSRHDLTPEGALCLMIMVTEDVASATGIEPHLHPSHGGAFDRAEAKILAESGLYSLQSSGYLRLDSKGVLETVSHDEKVFWLGDIQWLLTAKAARAMAPMYCACKGLDSAGQPEAVKAMLAANKRVVAENRKRLKNS